MLVVGGGALGWLTGILCGPSVTFGKKTWCMLIMMMWLLGVRFDLMIWRLLILGLRMMLCCLVWSFLLIMKMHPWLRLARTVRGRISSVGVGLLFTRCMCVNRLGVKWLLGPGRCVCVWIALAVGLSVPLRKVSLLERGKLVLADSLTCIVLLVPLLVCIVL